MSACRTALPCVWYSEQQMIGLKVLSALCVRLRNETIRFWEPRPRKGSQRGTALY